MPRKKTRQSNVTRVLSFRIPTRLKEAIDDSGINVKNICVGAISSTLFTSGHIGIRECKRIEREAMK